MTNNNNNDYGFLGKIDLALLNIDEFIERIKSSRELYMYDLRNEIVNEDVVKDIKNAFQLLILFTNEFIMEADIQLENIKE